MESHTSHFIDILSNYMSANSITTTELGKLIGCRDSCVTKWLNGYNQPSLEYVILTADKLELSIDYLLGLSEIAKPSKKYSSATFSERLDILIKKDKISKNRLAAKCGVTSSTVSKWLLRGQLPKPDIAVKLADIFNCSLDYLLARTDCK